MNQKLFVAGIFLFFNLCFGDNLIINPGFENTDTEKKPEYWKCTAGGEKDSIVIDSKVIKSGKNSLLLSHAKTDSYSFVEQTIDVSTNTQYLFSAFVNTLNLQGTGGFTRILIKGSSGELASLVYTAEQWKRKKADFNSGANSKIQISCWLYKKSGSVWFDDLILSVAPTNPKQEASLVQCTWLFSESEDLDDWTIDNFIEPRVENGVFIGKTVCVPGIKSPFMYTPEKDIEASNYTALKFSIKCPVSGNGTVYFRKKGEWYSEANTIRFTLIGDSAFRTYTIPIKNNNWNGIIQQLRITFIYQDNVEIEIPYFMITGASTGNTGGLIKNGSFEEPIIQGQTDGWKMTGNGIIFLHSKEKASDLETALKITGIGKGNIAAWDVYFDFLDSPVPYNFSFAYLLENSIAGTDINFRIAFQDSFYKEFKIIERSVEIISSEKFQTFNSQIYIPPLAAAASVMLEFNFHGKEKLFIDNVVFSDADLPELDYRSHVWDNWQSEWIRPGLQDHVTGSCFFRKMFSLTQKAVTAMLVITADDEVTGVFINGKRLVLQKNSGNWKAMDKYEIAQYLISGNNIFAVETFNRATWGGLLCEIGIVQDNGDHVLIKSDKSFKTSAKLSEGWEKPSFNDNTWQVPYSHGKAPDAYPWTGVPHEYTGPKQIVNINDIQFPAEVTCGKKTAFSLKFNPADSALSFFLKMRNQDHITTIFRADLSELSTEVQNTFHTNFTMPKIFSRGKTADFFMTSERVFFKTTQSGIENKNGELIISNTAIQTGPPEKLSIASFCYTSGKKPVLLLNGEKKEVLHHWTGNLGTLTESKLGNCRENELHIYWGNLNRPGWTNENCIDFSVIDNFCLNILSVDPSAYMLLQIGVYGDYDNYDTTLWQKKYPEEALKDENGNILLPIYATNNFRTLPSWASMVWLNQQKDNIRKIIRHVQQSSYGSRVIGYMPQNGLGVEWQHWGAYLPPKYLDYSTPFVTAFHIWLAEKYGNISALNSKYNKKYKIFSEVMLPDKEERQKEDFFGFISPERNQLLIDFRNFFSEHVFTAINELSRTVKEESNGRLLCGTYYGYILYILNGQWNEPGHFALGKALRSPHVDFYTQMVRYDNRSPGQESGFMSPESSYQLHNKVMFAQLDLRTVRSPEPIAKCYNIRDSIEVIKRECANFLISGVGLEYGYGGNGWQTEDKRLMAVYAKSREIELRIQNTLSQTQDPATSIAVVVDERSTYYTIQASQIHNSAISLQYPKFNHSGTGFDIFLLDDLESLTNYRCLVFLNTYNITSEQESFINQYLKKDNRVLYWQYAPGILDGKKINVERITKITGIPIKCIEKKIRPEIVITDTSDSLLKHLSANKVIPLSSFEIGPVFVPQEGTIIARNQNSKEPALSIKRFSGWTSIYSSWPAILPELLQGAAQNAGIHIANTNTTDATYLSDNLMAIHTVTGGNRILFIPKKYTKQATELFTDRVYPIKSNKILISCEPLSTYFFLFE